MPGWSGESQTRCTCANDFDFKPSFESYLRWDTCEVERVSCPPQAPLAAAESEK